MSGFRPAFSAQRKLANLIVVTYRRLIVRGLQHRVVDLTTDTDTDTSIVDLTADANADIIGTPLPAGIDLATGSDINLADSSTLVSAFSIACWLTSRAFN
jgi:hypothetical protein